MSAFSKLKATRTENTAKLQEFVKNDGKKTYEEDTRYWQLKGDPKTKTGSATIRFLPAIDGEDAPFVTLFEHAFQRSGGWYINKSRSTLGKDETDPVLEYNEKLWKSGNPADKVLVSGDDTKGIKGSKRKKYFISNILVIKHDAQPEDEGKVFLFKYGVKIKKMIDDLLVPEEEGEDAVDVTDFWDGKNFSFKMTRQGRHANYDSSKFLKSTELFEGDDEKKEEIYNSQYSLKAEISADKFKSYEQLSKELTRALGGVSQSAQVGRASSDEDDGTLESSFNDRPKKSSRQSFNEDSSDDEFFNTMKNGRATDTEDDIPF